MTSSPAIGTDGTIYVGSEDDKLYAIGGEQHTAQGTVKLEGMPNPITGARVTFSSDVAVHQVTSNPQDGTFEKQLPTGTYDVTVEKDGFLPARVIELQVDQDRTLPEVRLLGGDAKGDWMIDVGDLAIPGKNQGKTESPWELNGPPP